MINLITPAARRAIVKIYWIRVVTVWAVITAAGLLITLILLIPPYVLINSQVTAYQANATAAAEKIANYQTSSAVLVTASSRASWIVSEATNPSLFEVLSLIEKATIADILITNIAVQRTTIGITPITVSGVAAKRIPLIEYLERLQSLPEVEKAYFPNSNLSAGSDIPFTVEITLKSDAL